MNTLAPSQHLIIPFSACSSDAWQALIDQVPSSSFTHLNRLLRELRLAHTDQGTTDSLTPPHERVLARAYGLPTTDGLVPWAAWQYAQQGGQPGQDGWAHIHPCHWVMSPGVARMTDPAALELSASESQLLLASMQPYFATHALTLHYQSPTCWLAQGELLRELPSASLDRVIGQDVNAWLPAGALGRPLRVLQNEMQMLLYTHPLNADRQTRGQLAVNSFWLSSTGALPPPMPSTTQTIINMPRELAQASLQGSSADYRQAWAAINAQCATLWALQQAGESVQLSLCGERHALTFVSAPRRLGSRVLSKLTSLLGHQPLPNLLHSL